MKRGSVSSLRVGFKGKGNEEILVAPLSPVKQSIIVHQSDIANNSGSDAAVGYGFKLLNEDWKFGQHASDTYADDTVDAQASAGSVALTTDSLSNGFIAQASKKFDLVGFTVSTAETGTSVLSYEYWDGSAWVALNAIIAPDFSATGDTALVFAAPYDWAKGGSGGVDSDKYAIRVTPTTASSASPVASLVWVVQLLDLVGATADGSAINKTQYVNSSGNSVPPGHALVPYCSVSDSGNVCYIEYALL